MLHDYTDMTIMIPCPARFAGGKEEGRRRQLPRFSRERLPPSAFPPRLPRPNLSG